MDKIVSFDHEALILVDSQGRELGSLAKDACHDGDGVLHRALSVFVFNPRGEVLLQQRSASKRLWPGYWSNSCCSHPRWGESIGAAARRRVQEELGLQVDLTFRFEFEYRAQYLDVGTEHELCGVFTGVTSQEPQVNSNEVADWRWVAPTELTRALSEQPEYYTPWFIQEWATLMQSHPIVFQAQG